VAFRQTSNEKENSMNMSTDFDIKTPAWKSLCELTTDLAPKFDSRREAFAAACRQRPDLAAAARKKPGVSHARPGATPTGALDRACEKLAADWRG
jgi:hypothetical protein